MIHVIIPIPPMRIWFSLRVMKKPHHVDEVLEVEDSRDLALLAALEEPECTETQSRHRSWLRYSLECVSGVWA